MLSYFIGILFRAVSFGLGWQLILPQSWHLEVLYASSFLNMIVYLCLHPSQMTDLSTSPFIASFLCVALL